MLSTQRAVKLGDGQGSSGASRLSPKFVVRGLPLIHDKTVDEWGTEVLGYFITREPATLDHGRLRE